LNCLLIEQNAGLLSETGKSVAAVTAGCTDVWWLSQAFIIFMVVHYCRYQKHTIQERDL